MCVEILTACTKCETKFGGPVYKCDAVAEGGEGSDHRLCNRYTGITTTAEGFNDAQMLQDMGMIGGIPNERTENRTAPQAGQVDPVEFVDMWMNHHDMLHLLLEPPVFEAYLTWFPRDLTGNDDALRDAQTDEVALCPLCTQAEEQEHHEGVEAQEHQEGIEAQEHQEGVEERKHQAYVEDYPESAAYGYGHGYAGDMGGFSDEAIEEMMLDPDSQAFKELAEEIAKELDDGHTTDGSATIN